MDQNKQNQDPMGQYPPQGVPPSYDQTVGAYPTQQGGGGFATQGAYPAQQVGYATQGAYPAQQVGYVAQGAYPNATVSVPTGQPTAKMEKSSVMTVCTGCNNQIMTSVHDKINNNGIAWGVYSLCCSGLLYLLFLLFVDAFKTFTHKCPICGKVLTQFTPKMTGGEKAAIICAVCFNVVLFVSFVGMYAAGTAAAVSYSYDVNSYSSGSSNYGSSNYGSSNYGSSDSW